MNLNEFMEKNNIVIVAKANQQKRREYKNANRDKHSK